MTHIKNLCEVVPTFLKKGGDGTDIEQNKEENEGG